MRPLFPLLMLLFFPVPAPCGQASGFTLPDVNGDSVTLRDLRGSVVVAGFWVMWCESCRGEIPILQKIHENYSPRGVRVLGIHLEEKDAGRVKSFVQNAGISYTVLLDPDETAADRLHIKNTPSVVILNADGGMVKEFRGLGRKAVKELYRVLDSLTAVLKRIPADSTAPYKDEDLPVKPADE